MNDIRMTHRKKRKLRRKKKQMSRCLKESHKYVNTAITSKIHITNRLSVTSVVIGEYDICGIFVYSYSNNQLREYLYTSSFTAVGLLYHVNVFADRAQNLLFYYSDHIQKAR